MLYNDLAGKRLKAMYGDKKKQKPGKPDKEAPVAYKGDYPWTKVNKGTPKKRKK